jgi:NTP pyrophosphatase (non-canonical NTP hydrolase)
MTLQKPDTKLVKYILDCRTQGFEDWQIRDQLYNHDWQMDIVESAFYYIKRKEAEKIKKEEKKNEKMKAKIKSPITIHLPNEIISAVEKRAKKNLLSTEEQIADIIRRSVINQKKHGSDFNDNIDDKFIGLFSRKTSGRPEK